MFNEQKATVYAVNPTATSGLSVAFHCSLFSSFIKKVSFGRERSDWKSQHPSEGYARRCSSRSFFQLSFWNPKYIVSNLTSPSLRHRTKALYWTRQFNFVFSQPENWHFSNYNPDLLNEMSKGTLSRMPLAFLPFPHQRLPQVRQRHILELQMPLVHKSIFALLPESEENSSFTNKYTSEQRAATHLTKGGRQDEESSCPAHPDSLAL